MNKPDSEVDIINDIILHTRTMYLSTPYDCNFYGISYLGT